MSALTNNNESLRSIMNAVNNLPNISDNNVSIINTCTVTINGLGSNNSSVDGTIFDGNVIDKYSDTNKSSFTINNAVCGQYMVITGTFLKVAISGQATLLLNTALYQYTNPYIAIVYISGPDDVTITVSTT